MYVCVVLCHVFCCQVQHTLRRYINNSRNSTTASPATRHTSNVRVNSLDSSGYYSLRYFRCHIYACASPNCGHAWWLEAFHMNLKISKSHKYHACAIYFFIFCIFLWMSFMKSVFVKIWHYVINRRKISSKSLSFSKCLVSKSIR